MKTIHILFILPVLLTLISCQQSSIISVKSPGEKVVATVDLSDNQLTLSVSKNGKVVLTNSSLGLLLDSVNIGKDISLANKVEEKIIDEEYPLYGNHSRAINHCREILVPLKHQELNYQLLVRVYDDGVAVRYIIPDAKGKTINSDNTIFSLPDSAQCFLAEYADSNEELHKVSKFGEIRDNHPIVAPITIKSGGSYLAFSEAECLDFPDMSWVKQTGGIKANFTTNPNGWKNQKDTIVSPWRSVIIADDLTQLVNSDLITNLCKPPLSGTDFSWAKPGRVLWQ